MALPIVVRLSKLLEAGGTPPKGFSVRVVVFIPKQPSSVHEFIGPIFGPGDLRPISISSTINRWLAGAYCISPLVALWSRGSVGTCPARRSNDPQDNVKEKIQRNSLKK